MKNFIFLISGMMLLGCSGQNFTLPSNDNTFQQIPQFNNKVDILIMADDSSNMGKSQTSLSNQMQNMLSRLDSMGMDYQIAVTSSSLGAGFSGGKFIGSPKYITSKSANKVSQIVSRMNVGQTGSDLERGLSPIKSSLSTNLTGESAGFLRRDALLAVIVLSNEDDYSAGSIQSYIDFFDALKPPFSNGARAWLVNFLGVISLDPNCPTQTGVVTEYIEVGLRYMDLANASDGVKESICGADWSTVAANVRVRINQVMSDYYLAGPPVVASISVTINGVSVPKNNINGWSYNEKVEGAATKYFIRFHGSSLPQFFDKIRVQYDPIGPK